MIPATNASQFRSRYSHAVAPRSASVNAIFINSHMKNVAGFAVPLADEANRRTAMIPLGTTQLKPPSTAENAAGHPPSNPAMMPTRTVAINCRETMRSIFLSVFALAQWTCYVVVIT